MLFRRPTCHMEQQGPLGALRHHLLVEYRAIRLAENANNREHPTLSGI
jgi:hypothetical protein